MPSLFENAVSSIRMGVEDYGQQDHDRDISAVRNFYAGVLLLVKEALARRAPNADPQLVIAAKLKPVPDGDGGIMMEQVGHTTIDFQQISERAKDFGLAIDAQALRALNKIRNDLEHHYTSESAAAIRAAIGKGFPVVASLFRELEADPVELLGPAWTKMLETKELYDQELKETRATLAKVAWRSVSVAGGFIKCGGCQSELVEQVDPDNEVQDHIELHCRTCGAAPALEEAIEALLEDMYAGLSYVRAKEGGGDGPLYDCPACGRATLVEDEDGCANCGNELDYITECMRCCADISMRDFLDGLDEGLCSYCSYVKEKVMRDD